MPVGDKTPKVRRDLMDACRILMRSLLISRENEGAEWTRRLRMAVKHVEDAARAVARADRESVGADVDVSEHAVRRHARDQAPRGE